MTVSRTEIEERWLGARLPDSDADAMVEALSHVERLLGRDWLDSSNPSESRGPAAVLPLLLLGEQLQILERAADAEKLLRRLRLRDRAAYSELHAIAICGTDRAVEIAIEPTIRVDGGHRVPDFKIRRGSDSWLYVEVTYPDESESEQLAQAAVFALQPSLAAIPDGMEVQIRFRDEPTDDDLASARECLSKLSVGDVIDRPRFIVHALHAGPVLSPIGSDERGRPIVGSVVGRVAGESRTMLSARVPFTDARGQRIIDAEAHQLPKDGPGLICVLTSHGKYWRSLIERSFSPTIRRRIGGVLLFARGTTLVGPTRIGIQTIGQLLVNQHARTPLPAWLCDSLESLPRAFGISDT